MKLAGRAAKPAGELEGSSGAEVLKNSVRKNFKKVLDDAAKADQNLASLLLTTEAIATVRCSEESGSRCCSVAEYCEKKFSKILDDKAKSRLESRFFADDDKTKSATQIKS